MARGTGPAETATRSERGPSPAKKLAFVAILAVLPLLLAEGGARLWLAIAAPEGGRVDPAREAVETTWLDTLEQDLVTEQPDVALYKPDLELFWTLRPGTEALVENQVYETRGEPVRWRIRVNGDGQRGPAYPGPDVGADPVIVALGDSVTFGFRVNEEETFPAQLERYLRSHGRPRARVVNYGVPGYTSFQGRRLLERILAKHRPDVVLLAFGANDLESDRYSDAEKAARISPWRVRLAGWLEHLAVARLVRQAFTGGRRAPDADKEGTPRVSQSEYRDNMISMIEMARAAGAEAIVLDFVFIAPVFRDANREIAVETGVTEAEGHPALVAGLDKLLSGTGFQTERAEIDRFWETEVERYRTVYYSKDYYRKLFANPRASAMLRYLMVEPVHPNALGHRILAESIGDLILAGPAQ
jgi:lysophospholipase L1-like esterase